MNFSVENICNIGGCVLIFVLLALLLFKPSGVMSLIEGQNNNSGVSGSAPKSNSPPTTRTNTNNNGSAKVMASLPLGDNEQFASVSGIKTPTRSCYPQNTLKPDDLLPQDKKNDVNNFNKEYPVSEGILKGVNFLEAGYQVGVNTVGQSLRNANRQVRSEPPNPQVNVSPWMNTTIGPDLARAPLEIGEDCYASIGNNTL